MFWWPSPEAFEDLIIEYSDLGFTFDVPDDSECGEWLAFWSQSPEHLELFTEVVIKSLLNHANTILEQHGESTLTDEQEDDRVASEEVGSGSKQAD